MMAAFLRGLQFTLIPVPEFIMSLPDLPGFSTVRLSAGAQDISKGINEIILHIGRVTSFQSWKGSQK